jgi:hypothetical protein
MLKLSPDELFNLMEAIDYVPRHELLYNKVQLIKQKIRILLRGLKSKKDS